MEICQGISGILPIFMISKIAVARNTIIRSCASLSAKTKKKATVVKANCEAYYHYSILAAAAKELCRHIWTETERDHVGRNNYHWMNFHCMLHRLGILSRQKSKDTAKQPLFFSNTATYYYLRFGMRISRITYELTSPGAVGACLCVRMFLPLRTLFTQSLQHSIKIWSLWWVQRTAAAIYGCG